MRFYLEFYFYERTFYFVHTKMPAVLKFCFACL
nr:MAG TPA: hypothetical protein [Caudoviricetes sp.]